MPSPRTPVLRLRRPAANLLRPSLVIGLAAVLLATAGCSTLPFAPQRGAGAAFTLATVDHVSRRDEDLRRELRRAVEEQVATQIAAARVEDRARLDELQQSIDQSRADIAGLAERLQENDESLGQLAAQLMEQLDILTADAAEMRRVALQLEGEIDRLPLNTLRQLQEAIESHLGPPGPEALDAPAQPALLPPSGSPAPKSMPAPPTAARPATTALVPGGSATP